MIIKLQKASKLNSRHKQYLKDFLGNYKKLNKSDHTIKNYAADLIKFLDWYEHAIGEDASKTNARNIDAYKDYLSGVSFFKRQTLFKRFIGKIRKRKPQVLKQQPLSVGSRRRHISSIKNFFEYMVQAYDGKHRGFKENPVKSKIHSIALKDADINHTKLLGHGDFDSLLKVTRNQEQRLILYLLYYGGLRLEELTRVKKSSFSQKNHTLSLIRKGGSLHTFKLQNFENIFELLVKHTTDKNIKGDDIFLNRFKFPLSSRSMYSKVNLLIKKDGIAQKGLGPHSFRKACATNMYIECKDILKVRNYLNHKDAKVTQTYIEYFD